MQLLAFLLALILAPLNPLAPADALSPGDGAPLVQNGGMECVDGFYDQPGIPGMVPLGWTARILNGNPHIGSTQMWLTYGCKAEPNMYEKLEGYDSFVVKAVETPPYQDFPGPPFDLALYQQVKVTKGVDYSLSAWMVSFCGGTAVPSSCPSGNYIAKMAALDPSGGTDPMSAALKWVEDRRPHTEAPWTDLRLATTAQSDVLTIFLRVDSPFEHHGNYAHIDAVKLVRSPATRINYLAVSSKRQLELSWGGDLGPDIPAIPGSTHRLSFEAQVRRDDGAWQPWLSGVGPGSATYDVAGSCEDHQYQFRVRAWAIQPSGQPGSWPFHEFFGVWKTSERVEMAKTGVCRTRAFLPRVE